MGTYNPHCRKATMKRKPLDPLSSCSLFELLRSLGIADDDWDVLLVGDGSGTDWKNGIGFACILVDHYGNYRAPFFGGLNTGTSQLAEMLPYMFAMAWYRSGPGDVCREFRAAKGQKVRVHVITDNSHMANAGNGTDRRGKYKEFWAVYDSYSANGFDFTWHWVPRAKVGLNCIVDVMAGAVRQLMDCAKLSDGSFIRDLDLYMLNPVVPPASE